jgi:chemotaxis protein methyltransferase CheR
MKAVDLSPFKELLLRTCGHSFEKEREQTLSESLCRRMVSRSIEGYGAYFSLLSRDSDELHRLTELLTVNETYFFREPDHLSLIVDTLMPEFMADRNKKPIRILSAGCSTGEEPYSIAIMLKERFGADSERLYEIIGLDIDSTVIESAILGIYGKRSFRGMANSLLERYFEPVGPGKFQIRERIRKQVEFKVVNLMGAYYPQEIQQPDIILYRNVSIYFPGLVQREIFRKLAELLTDGGCLLVGATETLHHDIGILSLVKEASLFFYRKIPTLVFKERRTSSRCSSSPESPAKPTRTSTQMDVRERFDAAIALAHNKQFDKALAVLNAVIEQDSTFQKAHSLKGSLLLCLSRFDEAYHVCNNILSRDSFCREAYLMLGIIARQKSNDDEAIKRFREAIYLDASCWLGHFYSAEILFALHDNKRARSCYETTLKILDKGSLQKHGEDFFPLTFNADQFIVICRHKLSLLSSKNPIHAPTPIKGTKYGI